MVGETGQTNQATNQSIPNYTHSSQDIQAMTSLTKMLLGISDMLNAIRREFRGEVMIEDDSGATQWVQITKPAFVIVDFKTGKPKKEKRIMPWGKPPEEKEVYIPNDEAIEELLSIIKLMGVNQISPLGTNTEDNYLDDLKEFECKLAALLALKQKEWGLDKELLPMTQTKIKTFIQDVRSLAIKGKTLDALTKSVQRVEQSLEGQEFRKKLTGGSPY